MKSSDIILHKDFECFDGFHKGKFLIVLNNPKPEENFLVLLTTSKGFYKTFNGELRERPTVKGCHPPEGCFFIPQGSEWFPEPTWACFDFKEFDQQVTLKNEAKGTFKKKSSLTLLTFQLLINCIKNSQDLSPIQRKLISAPAKILC